MTTKSRAHQPPPPPPEKHQEPLPWCCPKPQAEDPDAPHKIRTIMESATYVPADRDLDFLQSDDTRSIRLQLDYLKPELQLRRKGIQRTIVVFGSTRIQEPEAARRRVEQLRKTLARHPGDKILRQRLVVAERILARSHYYGIARDLGRLVAEAAGGPADPRVVVMTGGGPGIMEAANRGAHDAGAQTVGLNISLPHEQFPNPYITPDLCFHFHYFALRKMHFLLRAAALVVLPGGFGTFDELFETLTLVQTRKIRPVPVVLIGEDYWKRVLDFEFMAEEGMIDPEDQDLFWYAESAEEAWQGISAWHRDNGTPI
ncbi:MAG TPA: LOG family protein [Gammaproteobacteria bacterium]|nr:LOG family protein [Gammaproteobacteria bacterium]